MAERTFVIIKPDSIVRGLSGELIARFERKGLKIVGMKMIKLKRKQFEELYSHLMERPFIDDYFKFMKRTPIIMIILEGMNAVEILRRMCGVTNGREAEPSTIRGAYSMSGRMNLIHAADSPTNAEKEIGIFFKPREIYNYKMLLTPIMYSIEELEALNAERKGGISGKPRKMPGKEDEP